MIENGLINAVGMIDVSTDEAVYWFDTALKKIRLYHDGHWGHALITRSGLVLEFHWRTMNPWPWLCNDDLDYVKHL